MKVIYKYRVQIEDTFTLELPRGSQILDVQTQDGHPCVWVLHDPTAPTCTVAFRLYGTGQLIDNLDGYRHVGSFQLKDGLLVFHLFVEEAKSFGAPSVR